MQTSWTFACQPYRLQFAWDDLPNNQQMHEESYMCVIECPCCILKAFALFHINTSVLFVSGQVKYAHDLLMPVSRLTIRELWVVHICFNKSYRLTCTCTLFFVGGNQLALASAVGWRLALPHRCTYHSTKWTGCQAQEPSGSV